MARKFLNGIDVAGTAVITVTGTLAAGEIGSTVLMTSTATLTANNATTAHAALLTIEPAGTVGSPVYYTGIGAQVNITNAANTRLGGATIYGGKSIVNFSNSATTGTTVDYLIANESELIINMLQVSGSTTINNVIGYQISPGPFSTAAGGTTVITNYKGLEIKPVAITGAGSTTITNHWNIYQEDTAGANYMGCPILLVGAHTPVVGALAHQGVGGIINRQASTNDAIRILGRAGGSASRQNTITTAALTASRTFTLPDADMAFVLSGGVTTADLLAYNGSAWVDASFSELGLVPTGAVTTSGLTMATARMLGRTTGATGAIEEITVGTGLSLSAGSLTCTVTGTVTSVAVSSTDLSVSGSPITTSGTITLNVNAGAITLAKMANLAANSIIGNNTGGAAVPLALTGTQVTAMLDNFTSALKGLVPLSGGGTTNFLRADGTWAVPGGGGGITGTLVSGRVPYANGASSLTDSAQMVFSATTGFNVNRTGTANALMLGVNAGNLTMAGNGVVLIGPNSGASLTGGDDCVLIGYDAGSTLTGANAVVLLGRQTGSSNASLVNAVAVGTLARTSTESVALGHSVESLGVSSITIGFACQNNAASSIMFGHSYANSADTNSLSFGSSVTAITNGYFGNGNYATDDTAVSSFTIQPSKAAGTNIAGGNFTVAGGRGTGTGAGGSLIFSTAKAGSSGVSLNALTTRFSILQDGAFAATGITTANAPAVSAANNGTIFYDSTLQKFRVSQNGAAYVDMIGGGSGTVTSVAVSSTDLSVSGSPITTAGTFTLNINTNAVTNAKLAQVATATFKGRTTAGTGDPEDLTVAQAKTLLNLAGTNTGDQTITLTSDVTGSGTGSFATTIAAGAVTLAKMANLAALRIIGNNTGGATTPIALTSAQVTAMLDVFTTSLQGVVPASGGGTTNFLRADGNWAASPGTIGGSIAATQVAYGSGANTIAGEANFVYDATNNVLTVVGAGTLTALTGLKLQTGDSVDAFIQNNIQNKSTGVTASSDWVATSDTGTDTTNFVDVGINGSGWVSGTWTVNGANDCYLYAGSTALAVGTAATGQALKLFSGGTLAANARMTFTDSLITMTPGARLSGSATAFTFTGATGDTPAASVECLDVDFDLTRSITFATGALALQRGIVIRPQTLAFVGASTVAEAVTLDITNAPQLGANATITAPWALRVNAGNSLFNGRVYVPAGTAALPSLTFNEAGVASDTGFYSIGDGQVGFTANAVLRVTFNTTSITSTVPFSAPAGSAVSTAYQFSGDTNTGMYQIAGNDLGFAADGNLIMGVRALSTQTSANVNIGAIAVATGRACAFRVVAAADTNQTTAVEASSVIFDLSATRQFATGSVATQRAIQILAPTYNSVGASVYTSVATVAISNAPIAGTNSTFTDTYALWIQAGLLGTAASTTTVAGFRVPHGAAPTVPKDGDFWSTSAGGFFGRVNGVTVGPFGVSNGTAVAKNSGATVGTRSRLNLIEGTGITLTVTDDVGNNEIDVTIDAAGSGGLSHGQVMQRAAAY